jgi:hypothetical protein
MNLLKQKIKFYGIKSPCKINKKELRIGTKIEFEHTSDKKIAKAIALSHLCGESPVYYSKGLIPMENKLKSMKGGLK